MWDKCTYIYTYKYILNICTLYRCMCKHYNQTPSQSVDNTFEARLIIINKDVLWQLCWPIYVMYMRLLYTYLFIYSCIKVFVCVGMFGHILNCSAFVCSHDWVLTRSLTLLALCRAISLTLPTCIVDSVALSTRMGSTVSIWQRRLATLWRALLNRTGLRLLNVNFQLKFKLKLCK